MVGQGAVPAPHSGCCGAPSPLPPPSGCLSPLLWLPKPSVLAWLSAAALRLGGGGGIAPDQPPLSPRVSRRSLHGLSWCHLHLSKALLSCGPSGMSAHKGRDAGSLAPRAGDPFAQALPRGSLLRVTSVLALAAALPLAAEMVATRPEVCEQSSPEAGHPLLSPRLRPRGGGAQRWSGPSVPWMMCSRAGGRPAEGSRSFG